MGPYLAAGRDRSVKASVMTKKEERLKKQQEKLAAELDRLENMRLYEKKYESCGLICGIDEAGRGPLAGPVVAGAVILPRDCQILYLNDSKKLTARRRELLYEEIMEKALAVGTGVVSHANDAVTIPEVTLKQVPIIKGDAKSVSIAAASVIAKVTRDRMMVEMDQKYPGYGFASNKGYGSAAHIASIREMGPCEIHRKTFIRNFTDHAE